MSLRPLHELIAEVAAGLDDVRRHRLAQVLPAALRVSCYLVRHKTTLIDQLVEEDKLDINDFITLLQHEGISPERYERH